MTLSPKQRLMRGEKPSPQQSRTWREHARWRAQRGIRAKKLQLESATTNEDREKILGAIADWERILKENQEPA